MSVFETIADFVPVWIPITDRLPKSQEDVLVTTDSGDVTEARFFKGVDGSCTWNYKRFWTLEVNDIPHRYSNHMRIQGYDLNSVLAWMPLPSPYKEKKHD